MRTCAVLCASIAVALAGGVRVSRGDSDRETAARIENLIKQLGDRKFSKREAASKELVELGKAAFRPLRRAAASSEDPEIRRRAELVIAAIIDRVPGLFQQAEVIHCIRWPGVHTFCTAFSPDGRYILAGGDSNTIRIYHAKTGGLINQLVGHQHWVTHAIFTPDSKQVLSWSGDRTVRQWDVGTGKEIRKLDNPPAGVGSVDLTRDGKSAVTGCGDGSLRLWEFATGKEMRKIEAHPGSCMGYFTPDGKQILSGCDRTLYLWDVATSKKLRTFEGHTAGLYGLFLLPGGKQALSYSADQTARVWDLKTGKEVNRINVGPSMSDIRGLSLSPDGKRILVGGARSNEVRLFEMASGKEIHRFLLAAPARGLSFSPDGRYAACGTWRGFVYLFRMPGIFDDD
jgi:WD40 repeat protein